VHQTSIHIIRAMSFVYKKDPGYYLGLRSR
jgi:hypothetical protein